MNTIQLPNQSELEKKALGAYLGFACGDALGATVEFMSPPQIQEKYGTHKDIIGGGWLRLKQGAVTDDTEMSLALGEALIEDQGWNINNVADHFVAWLDTHPPDIGDTCLKGIRRYRHTGELYGPVNEREAGNGACMRILPLILATLHTERHFETWVLQQNHITHHNPLSDQASITIGHIVRHLLTEHSEQIEDDIDQLVTIYPDFIYRPYPCKTSGYIVDTLQTVMHFFETTNTFEDCVTRTVNMGGDADTTGAMVGMLAGAKYGVDAIPKRWLKSLDQDVHKKIKSQTKALLSLAEALAED
jgi:ADP-ribosyl-[dinitrogen reductase] hydrolase